MGICPEEREGTGGGPGDDIFAGREVFVESGGDCVLMGIPSNGNPSPRWWPGLANTRMSTSTVDLNEIKLHESDTGSSEVQVVKLTERIHHLTEHLREHPKDISSRRGLLGLVARRRKLLDYLKDRQNDRYLNLIKTLKLRR